MSMAYWKTAVTPLLVHWSYCSLAISHRCGPLQYSHFLQNIHKRYSKLANEGESFMSWKHVLCSVFTIARQHAVPCHNWLAYNGCWLNYLFHVTFQKVGALLNCQDSDLSELIVHSFRRFTSTYDDIEVAIYSIFSHIIWSCYIMYHAIISQYYIILCNIISYVYFSELSVFNLQFKSDANDIAS